MTEQCKACRFYRPDTYYPNATQGRCLRNAPIRNRIQPETNEVDWCGEFQPIGPTAAPVTRPAETEDTIGPAATMNVQGVGPVVQTGPITNAGPEDVAALAGTPTIATGTDTTLGSVQRARWVARATEWSGDARVNFTTALNAARVLAKRCDELNAELDANCPTWEMDEAIAALEAKIAERDEEINALRIDQTKPGVVWVQVEGPTLAGLIDQCDRAARPWTRWRPDPDLMAVDVIEQLTGELISVRDGLAATAGDDDWRDTCDKLTEGGTR